MNRLRDASLATVVSVADRRFVVELRRRLEDGWTQCQEQLLARGVPLPLIHRTEWVEAVGGRHWLVSAGEQGQPPGCAFVMTATPTRAFPGQLVARADRVGAAADRVALWAALEGLTAMLKHRARVLRLEVGLFSIDPTLLEDGGEQLARLGFARLDPPRSYQTTSIIDLTPTEAELSLGLHPTARRHLRAVERSRLRLAPITSPHHVPAMQRLTAETRRRTHGPVPERPFEALVQLAWRRPDLVRIVGLFAEPRSELVAFAVGQSHGDHVCYSDAASTRRDDLRLPLGYAPAWELMRWGRDIGARWFDFGGLTEGSHGDPDDPLGGISDFKRYFRGQVVTVGFEAALEPHAYRAAVARTASRAANWARARMHALRDP